MADSRRASNRIIQNFQKRVETQTRIIHFLLCILASLLLIYILNDPSFTTAQYYVLFILFLSIGLWITEAIPPFAVGIFIVGFLVFFLGNPNINSETNQNYIDVIEFVHTWSNSVIWLILGGFFLAFGMKKTGLDQDIFKLTIKNFGSKPPMVLLGIMFATALASMVMSNTATTAMMMTCVAPLMNQLKKKSQFSKAVFLAIPASASIGGMGTIIGSPPNAIAVDALNHIKRLSFKIGFLEWMLFGVPVALILIFILWFFLVRKYKAKIENFDLDVILDEDTKSSPPEEITKEEEFVSFDTNEKYEVKQYNIRKKIVLGVLFITVLLWITSKLHNIPAAAISGIPIIIFTMVNIINSDDVRKLPWDTLMLVAGGLSLGLAVERIGLAEHFVERIKDFEFGSFSLIIIFSILTIVMSNFMSNTATATILIPMASLFIKVNPIILPMVISLCASCAIFLPVSTPPNAIAFSTGKLKVADFRYGGVIIGFSGIFVSIIWVYFLSLLI